MGERRFRFDEALGLKLESSDIVVFVSHQAER
jgi:hypothetical protein